MKEDKEWEEKKRGGSKGRKTNEEYGRRRGEGLEGKKGRGGRRRGKKYRKEDA